MSSQREVAAAKRDGYAVRRHIRTVIKNRIIPSIYRALLEEIKECIDAEDEENGAAPRPRRSWVPAPISTSAPFLAQIDPSRRIDAKKIIGMSEEDFEALLALLAPKIQKQDTLMKEALPARLKLEITLAYLSSPTNYNSLHDIYVVSKAAISGFVPEVCDAIYKTLRHAVKMPSCHEEWESIGDGFRDSWCLPNCCGAIDGRHIAVLKTDKGNNYNHNGTNSLAVIALADYKYCFSYFEVCNSGCELNRTVFDNCKLIEPLENGILPNGHFLVGSDAFPLKTYMVHPYDGFALSQEEITFNYRLNRAKRVIDNAFGVFFTRFRIFNQKLDAKSKNIVKLVSAACALHNWLVTNSNTYLFPGAVDDEILETGEIIPGQWRSDVGEFMGLEKYEDDETENSAQLFRDQIKDYLNNEGAVSWQKKIIIQQLKRKN